MTELSPQGRTVTHPEGCKEEGRTTCFPNQQRAKMELTWV